LVSETQAIKKRAFFEKKVNKIGGFLVSETQAPHRLREHGGVGILSVRNASFL